MNVSFVGLGKLGLPVALATEAMGHSVVGHDVDPAVARYVETGTVPYREAGVAERLRTTALRVLPLADTVTHGDLIFVTIQTPHAPQYEGVTRLPETRDDFDYSLLAAGVRDLSDEIERQGRSKVVVIVSTVLPGTIRREIAPLLGPNARLCYNPFFIAMGTTIADFLSPEFVLFGVEDEEAARAAEAFYQTIHDAPFYKTSIENAELIKVVYNTFISTKLAFVNTVMEMCHKLPGTHVDEVTDALKLATQRVISSQYLTGGMGDGGGCHPRDNIALSHLARELGLSFDWFENVMLQRERQTEWLADLVEEHAEGRPIVILGRSFKPETNIVTGSPSLLLANILRERGIEISLWDPHCGDPVDPPNRQPRCYFVGTRHPEFATYPFEDGSVVLDPWRFVAAPPGVRVVRVGIGT